MPGRILWYAAQALPQRCGYSYRTHALARAVAPLVTDLAVARQAPTGCTDLELAGLPTSPDQRHEEVRYLTAPPGLIPTRLDATIAMAQQRRIPGSHRLTRMLRLPRYARWIVEQAGTPTVVHAISPWPCGRDGLRLARRWRAKTVYEVRGFPELSDAVETGAHVDAEGIFRREAEVVRHADRGIAIGQGVADALVRGGCAASGLTIVPNGVDTRRLRRRSPNESLRRNLDVAGRFVFATITNVRRLEGIQLLVEAWPKILAAVPEAVFLLAGEGSYLRTLRREVHRIGIEGSFRLIGSFPQERLPDLYSIIDVVVLPRIPAQVCHLVTPLKPLEAMASEVPVIASNVGGLREMVRAGETGWTFPAGDTRALASACIEVARDEGERAAVAQRARRWVVENREWTSLAERVIDLYRAL